MEMVRTTKKLGTNFSIVSAIIGLIYYEMKP